MTSLSCHKWAKLISLNPNNPDIHFLTLPNESKQHQIPNKWRIYETPTGDTCIQNLSPSLVKIDDVHLELNEEKEIFNGERLSFPQDNAIEYSDYVFCLVNLQPKNDLKRAREEPLMITEETKKLVKVQNDLQQELTCSICMTTFSRLATLSPCQHSFCSPCLFNHLKSSVMCPLCRVVAVSVGKNLVLSNLLQVLQSNFPNLLKPNNSQEQTDLLGDIIKDDQGTYIGAFKNGKREGQGKMIYISGKIYEGAWKNNKREGKGVVHFANGNVYSGSWANNTFNGIGKFIWTSNSVYEGNWVDGIKNGYGEFRFSNGDIYKGAWKNDKREGKGVLRFNNGDEYEGYWENDQEHGNGRYLSKEEKKIYEKVWENGKIIAEWMMSYVEENGKEVRRSGRIAKQRRKDSSK